MSVFVDGVHGPVISQVEYNGCPSAYFCLRVVALITQHTLSHTLKSLICLSSMQNWKKSLMRNHFDGFFFFFKHSILAQVFSESQSSSRCSYVISGAEEQQLLSDKCTFLSKVKKKINT